jgi:putative tricarboxylic transport membrane protein
MIYGLKPGALMITERPDTFWGTVASMYVGNVMLLMLNLPLIGLWVQVLKVPYKTLFPLIHLFCFIGAYSISANVFSLYVMLIFGAMGYVPREKNYECAPLVLAFVLGPMMEKNLRQALILFDGNLSVFFTRPLSLAALVTSVLPLLTAVIPFVQKRRTTVIAED